MNVYLFDIDGTLLSSGGAGKAALEEGLAEEFGIRGTMQHIKLSGRTDRAITADLLRASGLDDSSENRDRLLRAYLRHLPVCLARSQGGLLPGVRSLLDVLQGLQGVALGLLTGNIQQGARIKLGHYGLGSEFAFGGYGDEYHDRDDVARAAVQAMHTFLNGITPRQIWVIGDTPYDVRCARAIGARAVAVTTGWHSREELAACRPDVLLDDLRDVRRLLPEN